jgi:hypothetical protein
MDWDRLERAWLRSLILRVLVVVFAFLFFSHFIAKLST